MKNLIIKSAIIFLVLVLGLNFSLAENPAYKLTTQNLNRVTPNILEFDIYLQHSNANNSKFEYILGQYFFDFNSKIANGGSLTYSIVMSDLPQSFQPKNPTVSENILRLFTNTVPGKESLPVISDKSPATLVARMRLVTTAETFSEASLDLKSRIGPDNPFTKVFAYVDNKIIDITNPEEVIAADNLSGIISNTEIPKEFALQQNYPNPFNPETTIKFDIPLSSDVKVTIYDITGKEIAILVNQELQPGKYEYKFNGSNFSSGIYFYHMVIHSDKIQADEFNQVKKMILLK